MRKLFMEFNNISSTHCHPECNEGSFDVTLFEKDSSLHSE